MALEAAKVAGYGSKQPFQRNLELESFVIHARCLEEFFCSKSTREGTMWATDFIPGFKAPGLNHVDLARMHREVAHLTYHRKRPGERGGWEIDKVGTPIFKASLNFLKALTGRPLLAFSSNEKKRVAILISELDSRAAHPPFSSFATGTSSTQTIAVTGYMEPNSSLPAPLDKYEVL